MVKNATKIWQRPWTAWIALCFAFFLLSLRTVNPYDIWYLLLVGEKFLSTGTVPQQEFFLYSGHGVPQLFGGWGYGVLAELARRTGGLVGLSLWNAALWTICLLLGVAVLRQRAGLRLGQTFRSQEVGALLLTLVAIYPLLLDRTAFRPEVTAYILWLLAYALLERGRRRNDFFQAWLLVPLLAWLEAWLHTAAVIFLPLLAAFMAEAVLEQRRLAEPRRLHSALPWLGALVATAVLPILNPNGAAQVYTNIAALLPTSLVGGEVLPHGSAFQKTPMYNMEYLPFWQLPHLYSLYIQATSLLIVLLLFGRRRLQMALSILPFTLYALLHARGLSLWGLAMLVPFGAFLLEWISHFLTKKTQQPCSDPDATRPAAARENYALPVGLLCFLLSGIALQNGGWSWPRAQEPYTKLMRPLRESLPEGGNIFTEYHLGAITAWSLGERYHVALAAHMVLPNPSAELHYTRVMLRQDGWQEELKRNGVKAFVLDLVALYGGQIMPLARRLAYDPEWYLVAVSGTTGVFLRLPEQGVSAHDRLVALKRYWRVVADAPTVSAADRSLAQHRLSQAEKLAGDELNWRLAQETDTTQSP